MGIPITTSPPGHGLNQGMQRLAEPEGEPAGGARFGGSSHVSEPCSPAAPATWRGGETWRGGPRPSRDGGPLAFRCRSGLQRWRSRGGGSARRCGEPSPAELTAPLLSPQGGNACLQLQQPGPAAASAHSLPGSSRSPPAGGSLGTPGLPGTRARPAGTGTRGTAGGRCWWPGLAPPPWHLFDITGRFGPTLRFGVALGDAPGRAPVSRRPPSCPSLFPRGAYAATAAPPRDVGRARWEFCLVAMSLGQE